MITHPLPYKLLLFDADGTLRRSTTGAPCPNTPDEWELMPHVRQVLQQYESDVAMTVVSNQAGVALRYLSYTMARQLLWDLLRAIDRTALGPYLCPHHVDAGCWCRKPSPYLLLQAHKEASGLWTPHVPLPRRDILAVGDQPSDQEAAQRAGVDFLWAKDFFGWTQMEDQP